MNFVQMAAQASTKTVRLSIEEKEAVARDCRSRFWSQVIVPIIIAEIEFLKVWDECEERKMIRFKQGVWLKATKGCFDRFHEWMGRGGNEMPRLIGDYGAQMSGLLKYELRSLYATFCSYFLQKGQKDVQFKAQIQVAVSFINLSKELFDGFFDLYSERFGIDLRADYLPARISEADAQFPHFADDVIRYLSNDLHPTKHYPSIKAYQAFCDKLLDEDTLDKAGLRALELNHEDDFLSKIERENMGLHRLKEKFRISEKPAKTG